MGIKVKKIKGFQKKEERKEERKEGVVRILEPQEKRNFPQTRLDNHEYNDFYEELQKDGTKYNEKKVDLKISYKDECDIDLNVVCNLNKINDISRKAELFLKNIFDKDIFEENK